MSDISNEMVDAFNRASGKVWKERAPKTQGDAVAVDRESTRAGLAAALAASDWRPTSNIERPDSPLCDCSRLESTPTNPLTKAAMDHHCDCQAVVTAAAMLGAYSKTAHARQCTCRDYRERND